jgi:hypothetical protein
MKVAVQSPVALTGTVKVIGVPPHSTVTLIIPDEQSVAVPLT